MKKLFITIAFVAAAFFAQAQLFVGGSLGVDMGSQKREDVKFQKTFEFNFNPTVGYMFAKNMGVGADIIFGTSKTTQPKIKQKPEGAMKVNTFGIAPYFRYVFIAGDKFNVYADAKISFQSGKVTMDDDYIPGDNELYKDGDKITTFGFGIVPGVQYCFNQHMSVVASINIIRLGFSMKTTKTTEATGEIDPETFEPKMEDVKYKESNFGLGVNEATPLNIGFVWTF